MNTQTELWRKWRERGPNHVFDPSLVASLGFPHSTQEFLVHVGVPTTENSRFPITQVFELLPRTASVISEQDLPEEAKNLRIFAENMKWSTGICADRRLYHCLEDTTGTIHTLYRASGAVKRGTPLFEHSFTNSSIHQWAEFLMIVDDYCDWYDDRGLYPFPKEIHEGDMELIDLPDYKEQVECTLSALRAADPDACAEAGQYISNSSRPPYYTRCSWTEWMCCLAFTAIPDW